MVNKNIKFLICFYEKLVNKKCKLEDLIIKYLVLGVMKYFYYGLY